MARVGTPNLGLGTWLDGENPGAGSQSVDSTGLNGNWIKLDTAVGLEHNPDGTHKSAIIDKGNLKTTVADGSSIEKHATNGLQVKALGIVAAMLGAGSVIAGKILGTGTGKAVDAATIGLNASNELEVKDDGITAPKISHDNKRTKILLAASWSGSQTGITFASVNGQVLTALKGLVLPRAGSITALTICTSTGQVFNTAYTYGTHVFAATANLALKSDGVVSPTAESVHVLINGSDLFTKQYDSDSYGQVVHTVLELEFDD